MMFGDKVHAASLSPVSGGETIASSDHFRHSRVLQALSTLNPAFSIIFLAARSCFCIWIAPLSNARAPPGTMPCCQQGFAVSGSKNWDALIQLGWTSKNELRRFKWSAQPKRHHRHSGPPKPMTENEAERYVRSLLDKLIAHLSRTTP